MVILDLEVLAQVLIISKHGVPNQQCLFICKPVGFGRACAPVNCAHLSFRLIKAQKREIPVENPSSVMQLLGHTGFLPRGSGGDADI